MKKTGYLFILSCLLFSACNDKTSKGDKQSQSNQSKSILPEVALIKESFTTLRDESDNVDSPALWHGKDGQNWVLATVKESNSVIVYDAASGEKIARFGNTCIGLGELNRPNGIAVIDNYAVIIERDNHRIQVFSLPDFEPLGVFGESVLRLPYDSSGYYLMVDQGKINNTFQVSDRKTLEYIGGFGGEITRNTEPVFPVQHS